MTCGKQARSVAVVAMFLATGCFADAGAVGTDEPDGTSTGASTGSADSSGSASGDSSSAETAVDDDSSTAGDGSSSTSDTDATGETSGAVCGDGDVAADEACDDGNRVDQDGCDNDCTLSTGVQSVATGLHHTCVLYFGGDVQCWGRASDGQLGHGPSVVDPVGDTELPSVLGPVPLTGGVQALAVGRSHSCVRYEDGDVRCWGDGANGRLGYVDENDIGDDETADAGGVVDIGGPVAKLALGDSHGCALLESGNIRCWGANHSGKLGFGLDPLDNVGDDETPASQGNVPLGGRVVIDVSAGLDNTCAAFEDGAVRCWGSDEFGQLGAMVGASVGDDETAADGPNVDLGGAQAVEVAVGAAIACARTADGEVYCWGRGGFGQMGSGSPEDIGDDDTPGGQGPVPLGDVATQITVGAQHVCALLDGGDVRCWGRSHLGQLGLALVLPVGDDETAADVATVDLGAPAVQVDSHGNHTCALLQTGGVRCWGAGTLGRLGYGNENNIGDDETPASAGDVMLTE